MDKLIKKRNVPQKLPSGKRYEVRFKVTLLKQPVRLTDTVLVALI